MNIVLNPYTFNKQNIFFLGKKNNNIIDGCFSKLIYSTDCCTINGMYFVIPFVCKSTSQNTREQSYPPPIKEGAHKREVGERKYNVFFYTYDPKNIEYITQLSKIENLILNTYKEINGLTKCNNTILSNQLYKGFFKIYKNIQPCKCGKPHKYMLKISGIWETNTEVGITYKITELCESI
jgi:hypothetical protein